MASHKPYSEREKILDQRLSDGVGYTCKQLMAYCNEEAESRGNKPITSKVTLLSDLLNIENTYHVVIKREKRGREYYYSYEDPTFSIYNNQLTYTEIMQLKEAIRIIRRFDGLPDFTCMKELQKRFSVSIHPRIGAIVGFSMNEYIRGQEFFDELYQSIVNHRTLEITYQPFGKESFQVIVHPYYLKEYNNRWFLFCLDHAKQYISQYALDRIKKISNAGVLYIKSTIHWADYFEDKIGVSGSGEAQRVQVWLSESQLAYIMTKPIHGSQKIVRRNEDGSALVQLEIIPNYEFLHLIMSFGEEAIIVEPKELADVIQGKIQSTLKKYQSVHEK